MNIIEGITKKFKEYKPTSWAIDNKTAIYIIAIIISIIGLTKFNTMPKEQFPDIVVPTISVTTVYVVFLSSLVRRFLLVFTLNSCARVVE